MRDVEIRDLVLRIPGVDPADARWIGERIAERLSFDMSAWREVDLPALSTIRVRIPSGATREVIVREVASAIARSLR